MSLFLYEDVQTCAHEPTGTCIELCVTEYKEQTCSVQPSTAPLNQQVRFLELNGLKAVRTEKVMFVLLCSCGIVNISFVVLLRRQRHYVVGVKR